MQLSAKNTYLEALFANVAKRDDFLSVVPRLDKNAFRDAIGQAAFRCPVKRVTWPVRFRCPWLTQVSAAD